MMKDEFTRRTHCTVNKKINTSSAILCSFSERCLSVSLQVVDSQCHAIDRLSHHYKLCRIAVAVLEISKVVASVAEKIVVRNGFGKILWSPGMTTTL